MGLDRLELAGRMTPPAACPVSSPAFSTADFRVAYALNAPSDRRITMTQTTPPAGGGDTLAPTPSTTNADAHF